MNIKATFLKTPIKQKYSWKHISNCAGVYQCTTPEYLDYRFVTIENDVGGYNTLIVSPDAINVMSTELYKNFEFFSAGESMEIIFSK